MMPKSRSMKLFPPSGLDPLALHVYGPALRRNPDYPEDQVPVWAIHFPEDQFRTFVLVDQVIDTGMIGGYRPDRSLPAGVGGAVVAYFLANTLLNVTTFDPWNWDRKGPPRITIADGMSKQDVYKETIRRYSRRNRG